MIEVTTEQPWRDAYLIAWIGASNPRAVQRTLDAHTATYGPEHVAVQAIRGHLEFLKGNGLGPDMDVLREVQTRGEVNRQHAFGPSTFGTNTVCKRCGLLPLDDDDLATPCEPDGDDK